MPSVRDLRRRCMDRHKGLVPAPIRCLAPAQLHGLCVSVECENETCFIKSNDLECSNERQSSFMQLLAYTGDSMGYVATRPTYGPFLILSPTLKRWGPPK